MATDNKSFDLVSIAPKRLAQEIFETRTIERPTHTDYTIFWQSKRFQRQIGHGVHRVRDAHQNGIGRILQNVLGDTFHDAGIHAEQFLARHTRFARQSRSDNHNIGVCRFCIIVCATHNGGVETEQLRSLHHIHCFTFRHTFFDVEHYNFVGYFVESQYISACSTHITCAYNCYF